MIYRNKKTGVAFDSPCTISGGDWVQEEDLVGGLPEDATIAEMKDYAEQHGIDLGDAKKKDEIAAVLASAR